MKKRKRESAGVQGPKKGQERMGSRRKETHRDRGGRGSRKQVNKGVSHDSWKDRCRMTPSPDSYRPHHP